MTPRRESLESLWRDIVDLPEDLDVALADARPESFRLLDDRERAALTPDAWGYLLELRRGGVLDADELELVIHSIASRRRDPVDRPELAAIVDHLLLGAGTDLAEPPAWRRSH